MEPLQLLGQLVVAIAEALELAAERLEEVPYGLTAAGESGHDGAILR
eukprot:CAMPEP_0175318082 /NCGR_PEP_ID=MMETSP0093-20121207/70251_1 /TAXON_ID=311494 /ORGANISM="Alexandrium monilatum, Strain CCMP3105" /LENGTH=46 /DNA_ID= /DNA_START= /DNA_END= /DNA_ORIENTATION=